MTRRRWELLGVVFWSAAVVAWPSFLFLCWWFG